MLYLWFEMSDTMWNKKQTVENIENIENVMLFHTLVFLEHITQVIHYNYVFVNFYYSKI